MYIAHLRPHALVAFSRAEKALPYTEGLNGKVITLDQALAYELLSESQTSQETSLGLGPCGALNGEGPFTQ